MDDSFRDALAQLFTAHCTPQVVRGIEGGQSAERLWGHIEASGFANALLSEVTGGAGLSLSAAYPLLALCGSFALPVPMAETMLARALLAQAQVDIPQGSISFGHAAVGNDGAWVCNVVRCGQVADWVLVQGSAHPAAASGAHNRLLASSDAKKTGAVFCLDAGLEWSPAAVASGLVVPGEFDFKTLEACLYAAQLAGAMQAVVTRTLQFANDRNQFGRPIGKFQAIQHQLSVISEQAFAASMAAQIGCQSATWVPDRTRVAIAKARTSEAAVEVAALSHSIHGAIGFTHEFDLQLFTRRLHLWREAGGSESYWQTVLGGELLDSHNGLALDLVRRTTD
jgi:acyl-CoA dehydrogenase